MQDIELTMVSQRVCQTFCNRSVGPKSRLEVHTRLGAPDDPTTRLEDWVGEPAANPYLYMTAQIVTAP